MTCKRLFLVVAVTLISFLAGCGGSSSQPAPQGGFTNASLNGTFAISFSGIDANGTFAAAGIITANGSGQITSGLLDVNRSPQPVTNLTISGSYNVHPDGRGVAGLNTSAGTFDLVFVIVGNNRALVTRFEQSATGSGAMDLVNPSAFSTAALTGTLVFNLSGLDSAGNVMSTVGSITTNAAGAVTSGIQDLSDNGTILTAQPISTGTVQVAGTGRGTASITTTTGTLNFAFYVVDATHIKMVETDALPALSGEAFRQTGATSNASINGPFAFTVAGNDLAAGPFAAGGVFTSNGAGGISSGTLDFNDAGAPTQNAPITGTYSLDASGRGTATISGIVTLDFVLYPTTNGVQMLNVDSGLQVSGTAFAQSGALSTASVQGAYGMNLTAATSGGELDSIASLNANGTGHITGITDINNVGSTSTGTSLTGSYTVDSTGHGPLTFQTGLGPQTMGIYVVNSNKALFVDLDTDIVAVGDMEHQ